ncbi:pyrroline-5-carboxylate reductase [Nesidiocoris tenuis]|uniref:Pyrroline-5-carboxylate reductase n=1 Tax=Nesidiocoris tenuis TaxID=355587 RepID=A0ABN7AAK7_9HEMI|nr:pyrroline-5-carboxylate reductase [Nesidiocoris tenuis]
MSIGFIGGGKMAHALASGFISAGVTKGSKIISSCAPEDTLSAQSFQALGARVTHNNTDVINNSEVAIMAVKPNVVPIVLKDINKVITPKHLLISVAMGVTLKNIEKELPASSRVVRVMPNTPALVRQGASVYAPGTAATDEDAETTERLFKSVGSVHRVGEYLFDPVTALSGSGPAYVYCVIEALADGGVRMGLSRELALQLAAQTVVGAGTMVTSTAEHPASLRDNVTSPGGSTSEGLYTLEEASVRSAFIRAVEKATQRCKEVNKSLM